MKKLNHKGNPVITDFEFKFGRFKGVAFDSSYQDHILINAIVLVRRQSKTYAIKVQVTKIIPKDQGPQGLHINEYFDEFTKLCEDVRHHWKEGDNDNVEYIFN